MMKSRGDKSKGFAYIEFTSEASVKEALRLDRTVVEGRPMFVSVCNSSRDPNRSKLKVMYTLHVVHAAHSCVSFYGPMPAVAWASIYTHCGSILHIQFIAKF